MYVEKKAKLYVQSLLNGNEKVDSELAKTLAYAEEDFSAGYVYAQEELEFAIKQLRAIVELGSPKKELYSVSIARYTLTKLGVKI
jgi:hypothetical protein